MAVSPAHLVCQTQLLEQDRDFYAIWCLCSVQMDLSGSGHWENGTIMGKRRLLSLIRFFFLEKKEEKKRREFLAFLRRWMETVGTIYY
jgi:hypothetical protein